MTCIAALQKKIFILYTRVKVKIRFVGLGCPRLKFFVRDRTVVKKGETKVKEVNNGV